AVLLGGVPEHVFERQRGLDDVVAEDVLELDRLCRRRDVVGRQLREDRVLVEDVVQLALEPRQLVVAQAEPGEVGDVLDVRTRQGGHAAMIPTMSASAIGPMPTIRRLTPADVEATADAYLRDHWGDRRANLSFVATHPGMRPFVADADGVVVGTGVLCVNGPVGWIGTVWVDPGWRRRGIATALTPATIEAA